MRRAALAISAMRVVAMSAKCQKRWLESASRVERLTALIEDLSKEPTLTTEYVWQLPPFHDWPRYRIEMRIRKRPSVRPRRFDQLAFDF